MAAQDSTNELPPYGRNWLMLVAGSILIGVALAFLFFGGNLLHKADVQSEPVLLEQLPDVAAEQSDRRFFSADRLLEAGDTAHDFTLNDPQGNSHTLEEFRGQPVVINFWATWCAPCRVEMPALQAAFVRHREDGLVILALDFDEGSNVVRDFFEELDLTFTPLLDQGGLVAEQYGVFNFPSTFFVSPDGVVKAVHRGPMSQSQVEDYIAQIIPVQE
jgi:peroxiredoxin